MNLPFRAHALCSAKDVVAPWLVARERISKYYADSVSIGLSWLVFRAVEVRIARFDIVVLGAKP